MKLTIRYTITQKPFPRNDKGRPEGGLCQTEYVIRSALLDFQSSGGWNRLDLLRHGELQNAVTVCGLNPVDIDTGDIKTAAVGAIEAFALDVVLLLLLLVKFPLGRDGQAVIFDVNLDVFFLKPGKLGIQDESIACIRHIRAKGGHRDAAKGMVAQAKENAALSGLAEAPIRYIVDDCKKFVEREIRRGNRYDGIIMDPPSYGRGPGGEIWKLENEVYDFVSLCTQVLSDNPVGVLINSYTTGLSPAVMQYILGVNILKKFGGSVSSSEIGLPVTQSGMVLPCGATAVWHR